jgi:hypothetical protein
MEQAVVTDLHRSLRGRKRGRMILELRQRKRAVDRERRPV